MKKTEYKIMTAKQIQDAQFIREHGQMKFARLSKAETVFAIENYLKYLSEDGWHLVSVCDHGFMGFLRGVNYYFSRHEKEVSTSEKNEN